MSSTIVGLAGFKADMNVEANITDNKTKASFILGTAPDAPSDENKTVVLEGSLVDFVFAESTITNNALSELFKNNDGVLRASQALHSAVYDYFGQLWDEHTGKNLNADHEASLAELDDSGIAAKVAELEGAIGAAATLTVTGAMKTIGDAYSISSDDESLLTLNNGTAELFTAGATTVTIGSLPIIENINNVKAPGNTWISNANADLKNLIKAVLDTKAGDEGATDLSGLGGGNSIDDKEAFLSFIIPSFSVSFKIKYDDDAGNVGLTREVVAAPIAPVNLTTIANSSSFGGESSNWSAKVTLTDNTDIDGAGYAAASQKQTQYRAVTVSTTSITIVDAAAKATMEADDVFPNNEIDEDGVDNINDLELTFDPVTATTESDTYIVNAANDNKDPNTRKNTFEFNSVENTLAPAGTSTVRIDYKADYDPNTHRTNYKN